MAFWLVLCPSMAHPVTMKAKRKTKGKDKEPQRAGWSKAPGRITVRPRNRPGRPTDYELTWRDAEGRHRQFFGTLDGAQAEAARKQVTMANAGAALAPVPTSLSIAQVREAEGAFSRLAGRHELAAVVDYFFRHHADPNASKPIGEAWREYLTAREADSSRTVRGKRKLRLRPRTMIQEESVLKRFAGFAVVESVPEALRPELDRVRVALEAGRAASVEEVMGRLAAPERAALRRILDGFAKPPALPALLRRLEAPLLDAVADARDRIEAARRPGPADLAEAFLTEVKGAAAPAVHEIGPDLVEWFLRSLRSKDGTAPASRKSWNNARHSLHGFFAWCAAPERGWCMVNPAATMAVFREEEVAEQRGPVHVLTASDARDLMDYAASHNGGAMVPFLALALFGGLRPGPMGEIWKLARWPDPENPDPAALFGEDGTLRIPADVAKTRRERKVRVRPALRAWLDRFGLDFWPKNADRMLKDIRARFGLRHDALRHTFFSMLVAADGSLAGAATEGGNSEAVLKRHYLDLRTKKEAADFWRILPKPAEGAKVVKGEFGTMGRKRA